MCRQLPQRFEPLAHRLTDLTACVCLLCFLFLLGPFPLKGQARLYLAQPPHWQLVPPTHPYLNCCTFILRPRSQSFLVLRFPGDPDASHTAPAIALNMGYWEHSMGAVVTTPPGLLSQHTLQHLFVLCFSGGGGVVCMHVSEHTAV